MYDFIYQERIKSFRTTLLFIVLAGFFFALFVWRYRTVGFRFGSGLTLFFGLFFLFYVLNYRELLIRISAEEVLLNFGLVRWRTKIRNIKEALFDDSPAMIKYGGAGVHFAVVGGEYRAFYNFLEYPRIVLRFHDKQGPVQALVLTTRNPEKILQIIQDNQENI